MDATGEESVVVCEVPEDLPADPLAHVSSLDLKSSGARSVVHLTQIAWDPNRPERVWGAGAGGLFAVDTASLTLLGRSPPLVPGVRPDYDTVQPLADGFVVVAERNTGLQVWNGSDPRHLSLTSSVSLPNALGMAADGDLLYVATMDGALHTFRVTSGTATLLSTTDGLGSPLRITVSGDLIYAADLALGVAVIDRTDPESPVFVGSVPVDGGAQDVEVAGQALYVAAGSAGLHALDLADPLQPVVAATVEVGEALVSVGVYGDRLWATDHEGVQAYDVSVPLSPVPLASEATSEWALDALGVEGGAVVANWSLVDTVTLDEGAAPELDLSADVLYFYEGSSSATLTLANRGSVDLEVVGASVDDTRFVLTPPDAPIPPGGSAELVVAFTDDGLEVDTELCIATNAPEGLVSVGLLSSSQELTSVAIGEAAPDFALEDLDGTVHQLSAQLGKPVLLAYFATW